MAAYQNYPTKTYKTLRELYRESAKKFGSATLFLQKENDVYKEYSYETFAQDVDALGTALLHRGLADAHIIVAGENSYAWILSYMAITCGVGVVVPVDKACSEERLTSILESADVTAILYGEKTAERVAALDDSIQKIAFSDLNTLLEEGRALIQSGCKDYVERPIDPNALCALRFTSGTTGKTKGVMLSHKNLCFNLSELGRMIRIDTSDVFLSVLPIHHIFECTCGILWPMACGATVAFSEGLRKMMKNMQEVSPTVVNCVPLFMETIYNKLWANIRTQGLERRVRGAIKVTNALPERVRIAAKRKVFTAIHKTFGGKLRMMISCGAAAKPTVLAGLRDFGILAIQSYGLTECAPLAAINRDTYYNDNSAGMATPNALLDIYDVHSDGTGEIRYKGDNVMIGYYKKPELTSEVIRDGWFYTGDLGYIDQNGFLYITGRKKNVILTAKGRHVFPEELELLLSRSPFVRESIVFGKLNKEKNDYDIIAVIQPDIPHMVSVYGRHYSPEQLDLEMKKAISEVNATVPKHKAIHSHILRRDDFPKNTSDKILRDPVLAEYL